SATSWARTASASTINARAGSWLCENALAGALTPCNWEASSNCKRFFSGARLCPDCRHERLNAEDVHNAREIVGQYVQGHLGGDARQRLHQKVRSAHPHLECAEGVFSCLTTHAHRLRVLIETLLHGFEHVFVFPSCDPAFVTCRAAPLRGQLEHAVVQ